MKHKIKIISYTFVLFLYTNLFEANKLNLKNNTNSLTFNKEFLNNVENLRKEISINKTEGVLKKIDIKFLSTNRYIIAGENIEKNSTIFSKPFNKLINIENPSVRNFCKNLTLEEFSNENIYKPQNQFDCLTFFMMVNLKNPIGEFKSFIKTIPKSFSEYYLFWSQGDFDNLKNSFFYVMIELKIKEMQNKFSLIKKTNLKNESYTFEDFIFPYYYTSMKNFNNIKLGNTNYLTLTPFMDLFYTKSNKEKNINISYSHDLTNNKTLIVKLTSEKNIPKNEEIILSNNNTDSNSNLNNFPIAEEIQKKNYTNYFVLKFQKEFIYNKINNLNSNLLIKILYELRKKNKQNLMKILSKNQIIKEDIKLFQFILNGLYAYENLELIEYLKNNLKVSKNNKKILQILLNENQLIKTNSKYLIDFIEILKGGKKLLAQNTNLDIVKQNKKYFDNLFK